MGPGILIKSLLQGSFSLMVFGWSQIIMDIQPLIVLLTGEGHLHGFSHTFIGASLLAVLSALSGKYLAQLGLKILHLNMSFPINITWTVSMLSAAIGCYSHVVLDSIMHSDVEPFFPFSLDNSMLGLISVTALHKVCLYSGLIGAAIFYGTTFFRQKS